MTLNGQLRLSKLECGGLLEFAVALVPMWETVLQSGDH